MSQIVLFFILSIIIHLSSSACIGKEDRFMLECLKIPEKDCLKKAKAHCKRSLWFNDVEWKSNVIKSKTWEKTFPNTPNPENTLTVKKILELKKQKKKKRKKMAPKKKMSTLKLKEKMDLQFKRFGIQSNLVSLTFDTTKIKKTEKKKRPIKSVRTFTATPSSITKGIKLQTKLIKAGKVFSTTYNVKTHGLYNTKEYLLFSKINMNKKKNIHNGLIKKISQQKKGEMSKVKKSQSNIHGDRGGITKHSPVKSINSQSKMINHNPLIKRIPVVGGRNRRRLPWGWDDYQNENIQGERAKIGGLYIYDHDHGAWISHCTAWAVSNIHIATAAHCFCGDHGWTPFTDLKWFPRHDSNNAPNDDEPNGEFWPAPFYKIWLPKEWLREGCSVDNGEDYAIAQLTEAHNLGGIGVTAIQLAPEENNYWLDHVPNPENLRAATPTNPYTLPAPVGDDGNGAINLYVSGYPVYYQFHQVSNRLSDIPGYDWYRRNDAQQYFEFKDSGFGAFSGSPIISLADRHSYGVLSGELTNPDPDAYHGYKPDDDVYFEGTEALEITTTRFNTLCFILSKYFNHNNVQNPICALYTNGHDDGLNPFEYRGNENQGNQDEEEHGGYNDDNNYNGGMYYNSDYDNGGGGYGDKNWWRAKALLWENKYDELDEDENVEKEYQYIFVHDSQNEMPIIAMILTIIPISIISFFAGSICVAIIGGLIYLAAKKKTYQRYEQ